MTVNQLIERLKESGDEKFRNQAVVRIVSTGGFKLYEDDIEVFNVKDGINNVDIMVESYYT